MSVLLTKTAMQARIADLERELRVERVATETDLLTRLHNRIGLERRVTARKGWFIMCDLDGFKRAQDRHPDGHAYGDRILEEFADFLKSLVWMAWELRVAARTGGDEFIVWVDNSDTADDVAHSVRCWKSRDGRVTASAGWGWTLQDADAALYRDKRSRARGILKAVRRWWKS